ncbi:PDZ domain-containing protein [Candidatus Thorarchaeota archaeon]|nr:MAG: PDZ domain-containing protein [Candidatus Thorarchaeota archaeon]
MDIVTTFLIIFGIYLVIYIVAQAIGIDKLSEKGVEAGTPFFLMWKTERLNAFLTRLGKKFPRAFFNIGVVVSFVGMGFGFYMFGENLLRFFFQPETAGGVVPIIPGVTITGLPLVYMIIALAITLVTHEFAHGLASAKDDIPIKSSGLLFFLVLFGAFVEPDEETFEEKVGPKSRLRMLAAGSYSNLIWGFFFFILLINMPAVLSIGYNPPSGAYIYDIAPGTPAAEALEVGDVIIGLNDTTIETWNEVSQFMADANAGDTLTIVTLEESVTVVLGSSDQNETRGYIGVYGADYWKPKPGWSLFLDPMFAFHFQQVVFWCFLILFSVALFNLLPIPALDGDRMLQNGLRLITDDETTVKRIIWPMRILSLGIVLLSIILSLVMGKGLF